MLNVGKHDNVQHQVCDLLYKKIRDLVVNECINADTDDDDNKDLESELIIGKGSFHLLLFSKGYP